MRLEAATGTKDATIDEAVEQLVDVRARINALQELEYFLGRYIVEAMEAEGSCLLYTSDAADE